MILKQMMVIIVVKKFDCLLIQNHILEIHHDSFELYVDGIAVPTSTLKNTLSTSILNDAALTLGATSGGGTPFTGQNY